jgi:hypothetical protein
MRIQIDTSALTEIKWYEYAVRFIFGGLITAVAGLIAGKFGPVVGGLFLAFPAIFPASATLIQKHEEEKKEQQGLKATARAAEAVSIDAAGAAIGSLALAAFGFLVWRELPNHAPWLVLMLSTITWLFLSVLLWEARKHL